MRILLMCFLLMSFSAHSKSIHITEPKTPIALYGLLGVSLICRDSNRITLEQRIEIEEIIKHYNKIRVEEKLPFSLNTFYQAAYEKWKVRYSSNPDFRDCKRILDKYSA